LIGREEVEVVWLGGGDEARASFFTPQQQWNDVGWRLISSWETTLLLGINDQTSSKPKKAVYVALWLFCLGRWALLYLAGGR
jgi:hypothetical protein